MATTTERREVEEGERNAGGRWAIGIAALAFVAVGISVVLVVSQGPTRVDPRQAQPANEPRAAPTVAAQPTATSPLWCDDELAVIEAVQQGLLPEKVLEKEPFRTKRFIAQGFIPREAAAPCDDSG